MRAKKWLKFWFVTIIIIIPGITALNFLIDPLWFFSHANKFNTLQIGFNERLQKSIKLKYNENLENIDTLLMGSSRSTFYNQNKFGDLKVFNFSFSDAYPYEYKYFIDYAKALKGNEFKNIIFGLDFFGSGKRKSIRERMDYLSELDKNPLYVLSNYMSLDTLQYSLLNMMRSITNHTGGRSYNRNNIAMVNKKDSQKVKKWANSRSKTYWKNMSYNENYVKILENLKNKNQKSNFIIYTTPLSQPFLNVIYNNKELKEYYFKWIKDMVSVFGKIYFFTLPNKLSKNYLDYSKDGDHFYPDTVENISKIILGKKAIKDFGVLITINNLDDILVILREEIESHDLNKSIE